MRIVIRLGGSVVASPLDPQRIVEYAEVLERLRLRGHELIVVVGGGTFARRLIDLSKRMGLGEDERDQVAIQASRVVAQILAGALGDAALRQIPETVEEAATLVCANRIVVMGGQQPGMTTDTVAALAAVRTHADLLVKATDQDGVYSKDPRRYADAVKLTRIPFGELRQYMQQTVHQVGMHQILDPTSASVLVEAKTRTVVVNGLRPQNIELAVEGESIGTVIE